MKKLYISLFFAISLTSTAQIIDIPDANFKARLLSSSSVATDEEGSQFNSLIDTNNDGEIQISEASQVTGLKLITSNPDATITSLTGIEYFTNLKKLRCSGNNIENINLSMLENLKYVSISGNNIIQLNAQNLTNLLELAAGANSLTNINLENLPNLKYLNLKYNQISNIDLSQLANLTDLDISDNPITELNLSDNTGLYTLIINNSNIINLDCSQTGVSYLDCSSNPNLEYVNVKNNVTSFSDPDMLYFSFKFNNLPSLATVCIDESEKNNFNIAHFDFDAGVDFFTGENCATAINVEPMNTNDITKEDSGIYPNPATSFITIKNDFISVQKIEIYSTLGQKVKDINVNNNMVTTDVSGLAAGTYIIRLYTSGGTESHKLIKI